jgi:hypothetical protein
MPASIKLQTTMMLNFTFEIFNEISSAILDIQTKGHLYDWQTDKESQHCWRRERRIEWDERDDHGFLMKFFAIFSLFSIRKSSG